VAFVEGTAERGGAGRGMLGCLPTPSGTFIPIDVENTVRSMKNITVDQRDNRGGSPKNPHTVHLLTKLSRRVRSMTDGQDFAQGKFPD
jgi:hypothetical protein